MNIAAIIRSMRPAQWTKNLFVFAALIFARRFFSPRDLALTLGAFLVFCVVSGAFYIFNDIKDCEEDRAHPKKCLRPIAHGDLGKGRAMAASIILTVIGLAAAFLLHRNFFYAVAIYLALQLA